MKLEVVNTKGRSKIEEEVLKISVIENAHSTEFCATKGKDTGLVFCRIEDNGTFEFFPNTLTSLGLRNTNVKY